MGVAVISREQERDFQNLLPDYKDNMARIVALLREGEITGRRMLPRGSNNVFLLSLRKNDNTMWAIYKPRRGEAPLWDFPDGTLYRREVAAYRISQALGWHLVPPTEIREGPYGIGVVQQFVTNSGRGYPDQVWKHILEFKRMAIFDVLVNNADRKAGHCIIGEDGHVWGIDHGLTFNVMPKLRTVIWDFSGQPIPGDLTADLHRMYKQMDGKSSLRNMLLNFITVNEIDALDRRLRMIIKRPVFPVWSGSYHSIPWPPY